MAHALPDPQAALFRASSDDVDHQAELLRGWNQSYAQVSAGKFFGSVTEIALGPARIFSEHTGQALMQSGLLPDDLIALGLPLDMPGPAVFCGMPDDSRALHVFSGGNGFEFLSPEGMTMAGLVVSRAALTDLLSESERALLDQKFGAAHLARVETQAAAATRDFVRGVLEMAENAPQLLDNGPIMDTLAKGLLSNVAGLISAYGDGPREAAPARRWAIVAQARDYALSRPDEPTGVAELCAITGVSRRTLQNCFQETLGMSPAQFLRAVRMNGVRRMLRTAQSVTEAAAHWGFWHFGHFARDYAALFGELPSQTHRRLNPRRPH
ncbi:AraC family ethanolamine operon transcriptional activator [Rhodoblastus acidophilus]|uniref:helix-turn-helix domain-containing protein n=1 Tax=Rhodoblastus acidophilus TaxID=1074 RepID=UPI0022253622|nr:helix-turn-helix domain-containing protein [Rhodoblastus acidophilus]MCW2286257.1 AraC family ethanolamine operon transcriptional activator [Rhodoblastus acidophilus]MCW2335163.1 AraC family ethanolamine operon transcriptional activator [Rhodoblastus acidophilus]